VLRELGIDPQELAPREAHARIDRAKQDGRGPETFSRRGPWDERLARVYAEYDRRLRAANAADFGDLLVLAVRLVEENAELQRSLRDRLLHVLVDEFQDTNRIQFRLLQALVGERRNVCVVGDDDQSIYRWRGAEVRNILDFERHFPGAAVVRLEQNYRSTSRVLAAAAAVVRRNESRHPKELWTANPPGDPVRVVLAGDEREEAAAVARLVATLHAEGSPLAEQALFYRVNAQSRVLEEAMRARGIPYVVVGGFRFYERAEVKDLLAYLRLLVNPADDVSFLRIVNVPPRGIGRVSVERLAHHARTTGLSLLAAAPGAEGISDMPPAGGRQLAALAGRFAAWQGALVEGPAEVARRVFEESGCRAALEEDRAPEAEARLQNVRELIGSIAAWAREHEAPTLGGYLEHVALQTPVDDWDGRADRVVLMTAHSAKGLEFDTVYVVGLEEGLLPYLRRDEDDAEERQARLEEERRLCYVAMTRARKRLWLFRARRRSLFGGEQANPPSRFLGDVPAEVVEEAVLPGARDDGSWSGVVRRPSPARKGAAERAVPWENASSPEIEDEIRQAVAEEAGLGLRVGDRVRHVQFGVGRVVDILGGREPKVAVDFPGWGTKKILGRFVEKA
jgi:DNA helicase-2/ATP-dependent DNA helicase PcrA